jgi:hypothetical protein
MKRRAALLLLLLQQHWAHSTSAWAGVEQPLAASRALLKTPLIMRRATELAGIVPSSSSVSACDSWEIKQYKRTCGQDENLQGLSAAACQVLLKAVVSDFWVVLHWCLVWQGAVWGRQSSRCFKHIRSLHDSASRHFCFAMAPPSAWPSCRLVLEKHTDAVIKI